MSEAAEAWGGMRGGGGEGWGRQTGGLNQRRYGTDKPRELCWKTLNDRISEP